jgi:hypothetical protein
MQRTIYWLTLAAVGCSLALADEPVIERREIEDSLPVTEPVRLVVDNVFGSIRVETHDVASVEFVATETIEARDDEARRRARDEVELRVDHTDDAVTLFVDGPFRCGDDCHCRPFGLRYVVRYDFVVQVPRSTEVELSTVNDGNIDVSGIRGDYDVRNVNGRIRMTRVTGSGDAATVNGAIEVVFDRNPAGPSSFTTVNGRLDTVFRPGLSADLALKTGNGDILTDFDVRPLPSEAPRKREEDGTTVIETSRWTGVRVANGGPRLTFETLNGDIFIRRAIR